MLSKEGLIMADQTLPLNVSDEMKSDDERQNCVGMENDDEIQHFLTLSHKLN